MIFSIINAVCNFIAVFDVCDICIDFYICIVSDDFGSDNQTSAAEIFKLKMCIINADNVDISVKTDIESEVGTLRINFLIR